jgi:hypothetical protein
MATSNNARVRCVDCGTTDGRRAISVYRGLSTAPEDEGHVRAQRLALCQRCAAGRFAAQEQVPIYGWPMLG